MNGWLLGTWESHVRMFAEATGCLSCWLVVACRCLYRSIERGISDCCVIIPNKWQSCYSILSISTIMTITKKMLISMTPAPKQQ